MKALFFGLIFLFLGCSKKSEGISHICLEGHTYINYKNMLALKVDDQGNPTKCPSDPIKDLKKNEMVKHAQDWVKLIDEKNFANSWHEAAPFFKNAISQKEWEKKVNEANRQLGKVIKRELKSSFDEGQKATVIFRTSFENLPQATETISMILVEGKWMVVGYFVQ